MMLPTNAWPVYQWRKVVQWLLAQKMYRGWSQAQLDEKRQIVVQDGRLSWADRRRLDHLNWWVGSGSTTYFKPVSPAEHLRRSRIIDNAIARVKAEAEGKE